MQTSWGKIIGYSLLTLVLLNILYAFFLYEKRYEPITITLTVETDFDSYTWYSLQPNFSDSISKTETLPLFKNKLNTIVTTINQPEGLQFFGFYWSGSTKGSIIIKDVTLASKNKVRTFNNLDKFVNYSSTNVTPVSTQNSIIATAGQKGNGWLMLNLEGFEKIAKTKQFTPLGWVTNILLLMVLLVMGRFYINTVPYNFTNLKVEGSALYKARNYLFYLWMFLLPFWLIISHILLAVSLALTLVHFIVEKEKFHFRELKNFIPLGTLFLAIMIVNVFFHFETIGTDFGNYSYFLLAPFLFLGVQRAQMVKIFKVFQIAVVTYVFLLVIAIIERYLHLSSNYNFTRFFFETVEQYWHSSYLAGLIVVALLFEFQRKKIRISVMLFSMLAFVFMYLSQARLPLLIGLVLMVSVTIIQFPKKLKTIYISVGVSLVLLAGVFVYTSNEARERITTIFLVNDTKKMDARPELWREAFAISTTHLVSGIGSQNVRDALSNNLEVDSEIKYRRYNVHNQYLEFLLAYGILVPTMLIFVILIPIILGFRTTTLFLIYFSIAMLVESYFSRQAGVVVFSIFYCFFIFYDCKSKQHTEASSQ
ncbi:O-antigen ligase family protein [Rasiella sp. SM2506]|uniref:O-antigen ligase family protein n=1 Tax=Rasiella sp. SM2506 TaxID=3423914 RepID=UPI003D7A6004